ncbi:phage head closure protein [Thermoanaerobacterium thermosaccharolyticum]|uniref:phage head closure protein n=1 Tax=Thermoanaerobacterium thermosaccharolyticum TaxID=1517 RepID=UPI003DA9E4DA
MNAGKLRHRATIQQLVNIDDGAGGSIETWQDIVTVWAAIEPLRGNERYTAQQVQSTLSHKVTIRYREGIKSQMRLTYKGRIFDIVSAIDIKELHQWLELLCSEVVQ